MTQKRFLLVLASFILILTSLTLAQVYSCTTDNDCVDKTGSEHYGCKQGRCYFSCSEDLDCQLEFDSSEYVCHQNYCYLSCSSDANCSGNQICLNNVCQISTTQNITKEAENITKEAEIINYSQEISSLSQKIQQINLKLADLTTELQTLTQNVQTIITNFQTLNSQQQSLKTTLNQNTQNLNTISSGLASLQTDLTTTQTGITNLEEQLTEIEGSRSFTKKILILLVFLAAFAAIALYITYTKRPKLKTPPELKRHIYRSLQKGQPFSTIRKDLLKAGWLTHHIDAAYKEVLTYRYQKYQKAKKPALKFKKPPIPKDKEKILIITVITLIVILALFFLIQTGVLGKAIQVQRIFAHEEPFICTPPHIVTEGGCCLDLNDNKLCDILEEYEKERVAVSAEICHDHNDCAFGELCIDNQCGLLRDLYKTNCPERCNLNKIKILTNDGETYTLHAKKGSYTAAGALAWTIRPIPNYCRGEEIRVPIEIEKIDLVCYDELGTEISCDQSTDLQCTTNRECAVCPQYYNVPCQCRITHPTLPGKCIKDVIKKIKTRILSKELITLTLGQTSPPQTHPNPQVNKRLAGFTLTLTDANEFCFS